MADFLSTPNSPMETHKNRYNKFLHLTRIQKQTHSKAGLELFFKTVHKYASEFIAGIDQENHLKLGIRDDNKRTLATRLTEEVVKNWKIVP